MKLSSLFQQEDRTAIEKWCRAHVQQAYLGQHTALCRVLGKFLMYVDTRDLSLTPHLLMNGFWEMWVTQAIAGYVKPGMHCIDVGANVGYYTLLLADLVGEKGVVTAYEPQMRLCSLMERSLRVNGLAAPVMRRAVSNCTQFNVPLYEDDCLMGSAALVEFEGSSAQEHVTQSPLDELGGPIDFVKIDVQGHEMQVLEGMLNLIQRSPKIAIAMEFTPAEHPDPQAALLTIQGYGLKIQTIGTDGTVRPIPLEEAAQADTGDHRMLWLTREG